MGDYSRGPHILEHYALLAYVLAFQPEGVALEFGVGKGSSTRLIAAHMPVIGFDSGQGLPSDWRPEYRQGHFAHGIPDIDGATIIPGWFEDTLPFMDFDALGTIGLLHIDCDVYSSTQTVLKWVAPHLKPGAFVVFDEFWDYDDGPGASYRDHEQKAWREYIDDSGIDWTVVGHSLEAWAVQIV
jgi:predicted O-methyltransferase YrrM